MPLRTVCTFFLSARALSLCIFLNFHSSWSTPNKECAAAAESQLFIAQYTLCMCIREIKSGVLDFLSWIFQAIFCRHIRSSQISTHNIIIIPATATSKLLNNIASVWLHARCVYFKIGWAKSTEGAEKNFSLTKSHARLFFKFYRMEGFKKWHKYFGLYSSKRGPIIKIK